MRLSAFGSLLICLCVATLARTTQAANSCYNTAPNLNNGELNVTSPEVDAIVGVFNAQIYNNRTNNGSPVQVLGCVTYAKYFNATNSNWTRWQVESHVYDTQCTKNDTQKISSFDTNALLRMCNGTTEKKPLLCTFNLYPKYKINPDIFTRNCRGNVNINSQSWTIPVG